MSELITIARPYAKAAFEYAHEHKQIPSWSAFLSIAAQVISDKKVRFMLDDPRIAKSTVLELLNEVFDNKLDSHQQNFLRLLMSYHRLNLLPEIAALFKEQEQELQKAIQVHITSAFAINKRQIDKFIQALKIRLQREVTLETSVDNQLIGGAIIRAGDLVIDGSVVSQINRMKELLEQ